MRYASATDVTPNFITTVPDTLASLGVARDSLTLRPMKRLTTQGLSIHLDDWTTLD